MANKEAECEDVDWIYFSEGMVQWQACVNIKMNFWVGNLLTE
jgi:hypothetical protein